MLVAPLAAASGAFFIRPGDGPEGAVSGSHVNIIFRSSFTFIHLQLSARPAPPSDCYSTNQGDPVAQGAHP